MAHPNQELLMGPKVKMKVVKLSSFQHYAAATDQKRHTDHYQGETWFPSPKVHLDLTARSKSAEVQHRFKISATFSTAGKEVYQECLNHTGRARIRSDGAVENVDGGLAQCPHNVKAMLEACGLDTRYVSTVKVRTPGDETATAVTSQAPLTSFVETVKFMIPRLKTLLAEAKPAEDLETPDRKQMRASKSKDRLKKNPKWSGKKGSRQKKGTALRESTGSSGSGLITRRPLTLDIILTVPEDCPERHPSAGLHVDPDLEQRKARHRATFKKLENGAARKALERALRQAKQTFMLTLTTKDTDTLDADYAERERRTASDQIARYSTDTLATGHDVVNDGGDDTDGADGAAFGEITRRCNRTSITVTKIKAKNKCEYGVMKGSLHVVRDPRYFFWKLMLVQCALTTASFSLLLPSDMDNR